MARETGDGVCFKNHHVFSHLAAHFCVSKSSRVETTSSSGSLAFS